MQGQENSAGECERETLWNGPVKKEKAERMRQKGEGWEREEGRGGRKSRRPTPNNNYNKS